jgi:Amt family ammonium transporter
LVFGLLRHFNLLRVDQMTELAGIDNIDHGGPAYPEFNMTPLNGAGSPHGGSQ